MVRRFAILGLQGDCDAHLKAMGEVGAEAHVIRRPADLEDSAGLILPGGESTTLLKLMEDLEFLDPIRRFHATGRPIFGTCAGAILLAVRVTHPEQDSLGLADIDIRRNAYGRQNESFESSEAVLDPDAGEILAQAEAGPLELIFIRAPRIDRCGPGVRVLVRHGGEPVLVRHENVLAGTFHPEMTADRRVHRYFAGMSAPVVSATRARS